MAKLKENSTILKHTGEEIIATEESVDRKLLLKADKDDLDAHKAEDVTQAHGLDYEEGTWTPILSTTGDTPLIDYLFQYGEYLRLGNKVFATCNIRATVTDKGTGDIIVEGVPFAGRQNRFGGVSIGFSTLINGGITGGNLSNGQIYIRRFAERIDASEFSTLGQQYLTFAIQYDI